MVHLAEDELYLDAFTVCHGAFFSYPVKAFSHTKAYVVTYIIEISHILLLLFIAVFHCLYGAAPNNLQATADLCWSQERTALHNPK